MYLNLRIKLNDKLYIRNPEDTLLGRKIVHSGLVLINKIGLEDFTFKKLAKEMGTTEASIYRYFENKHRLLTYIVSWYWSYMDYKVVLTLQNINNPEQKLKRIIDLLAMPAADGIDNDYIAEAEAFNLVMCEGSKTYLTRTVAANNEDKFFKPYKDLCARLADIIKEYSPNYRFPRSLATTIIEMAHMQKFFMHNLPSLTDFANDKSDKKTVEFLNSLLFDTLGNQTKTKQTRTNK